MTRYEKILYAILLIISFPIIVIFWVIATPIVAIINRIQYRRSHYYKDFKARYQENILYRAGYIFYNAIKEKDIGVRFIRQESNNYEYFIYNGSVYLFPDFDGLRYDPNDGQWLTVYRRYEEEACSSFDSLLQEEKRMLDDSVSDLPVRIIVPRAMIEVVDLKEASLHPSFFVVRDYEDAFENADADGWAIIPQTIRELYEALIKNPELGGSFSLVNEELLVWECKNLVLDIFDGGLFFNIRFDGKREKRLAEWELQDENIYDVICDITKKGNALVIKTFMGSGRVLYFGEKESCRYSENKKGLFSMIHLFVFE